MKRLEHELEEDEKAREIAKLHGLDGVEIVTAPVPTFEGLKDVDLEAERKGDLYDCDCCTIRLDDINELG